MTSERISHERPDGTRWDATLEPGPLGGGERFATLRVEVPLTRVKDYAEAERRMGMAAQALRGEEMPMATFMGLTFEQWKERLSGKQEMIRQLARVLRDYRRGHTHVTTERDVLRVYAGTTELGFLLSSLFLQPIGKHQLIRPILGVFFNRLEEPLLGNHTISAVGLASRHFSQAATAASSTLRRVG